MATNLAQTLKGCRSWADLQRRWRPFTKKQKGDLFEELTKHYLCLEPEYATKLKFVWLLRELPTSIAKRLKLPSGDQGIDLVAETKDGEYWAIQSKYRQESDQSITWREISTFTGLAFGVCREFSYGLIASTTERITNVLQHQDRIGFAALDVWQGLDEEFFKRLQNHLYHKRGVLKPRLPRPHQNKAIADALTYFIKKKQKRGKLIMPCGTGKSLTSYFIAQKLKARKIVIAVPSLSLIKQTLKAWMYESMARKQDVEWICVCSDESAGKVEQDDTVVLKQDLGVPCLTNSKEIAEWLKRKHDSLTIVFTTYQSGQSLAKAARDAAFTFDLGIMDEAHKTAGSRERVFSHLVLDKNIKISRRLFMTATERRYQGQSDEILSMEDPDDYGETIHKLSFKKALDYKPAILSDYKVVTIHISQEEIADLVRNRSFVRPKTKGWSKEMEAENLATLIALRKAMSKYPIRHAVSFHGSIKRAQEFQESNDAYSKSFPSSGRLQTFHVSGKTPTGTRAKEIDQFSKAPRSLITNARCLTEGVDVPNIDAVLFADPRKSLVDIVQAVGRALRPSPNKQFGYVIVPVVHEKNAKPNDVFDSDSFKEVLTTLRALGSQDDRLIEYFRAISQGRPSRNKRPLEDILTEKLAKRIDLKEFVKSVEIRCWDRLAKLAWRSFEEARQYSRSLGLRKASEWMEISTGSNRRIPADIPSNPNAVYKTNGWQGWGSWLGTDVVSTHKRLHEQFQKARKWVRGLGLKNAEEWRLYCKGKMPKKPKLPANIPKAPWGIYKEWKGTNDWVSGQGGRDILNFCRPFKKARIFARKLKLKSAKEWFGYINKTKKSNKFPTDIPTAPNSTYKDKGWNNWGDWLGTYELSVVKKSHSFLSFIKAKSYVRRLGYISVKEYIMKRNALPLEIPKYPNEVYRISGWKNWADFLGLNVIKYKSFKEARSFARNLKLKNIFEWNEFVRKNTAQRTRGNYEGIKRSKEAFPRDMPLYPQNYYLEKGWKGFLDFLGLQRGCVLPFKKAKQLLKKLKLSNQAQYRRYVRTQKTNNKMPSNLPITPETVFMKKGWKGWNDFLDTKHIPYAQREWCSFKQARDYARGLSLKSQSAWKDHAKGRQTRLNIKSKYPLFVPYSVQIIYRRRGWKGWANFLGTER